MTDRPQDISRLQDIKARLSEDEDGDPAYIGRVEELINDLEFVIHEFELMTINRDTLMSALEKVMNLASGQREKLAKYETAFARFWVAPDADDVLCVWMWWRGQPVVVIGLDALQIDLADGLEAILPAEAPDA